MDKQNPMRKEASKRQVDEKGCEEEAGGGGGPLRAAGGGAEGRWDEEGKEGCRRIG